MRISDLEIRRETKGLSQFHMDNLGQHVILCGENGSGKTRLLKLINETIKAKKTVTDDLKISFSNEFGTEIMVNSPIIVPIINYSYSDLPLQSAIGFPPYTVGKANENLKKEGVDFSQTARDSLLYLTYLTRYDTSDELEKFNKNYCEPLLGQAIKASNDSDKIPMLFGFKLNDLSIAPISPGQKYLLRLCIALSCNIIKSGTILFLDEPEAHLHPRVLLNVFEKLTSDKFSLGQLWISTHSIELISGFNNHDIWIMGKFENEKGIKEQKAKRVKSNSELIIDNLLGGERNRFLLREFVSSPELFACNVFATQCLCNPEVIESVSKEDPSTGLVHPQLKKDDVVVDFGAGKGRFLTSFYMQENAVPITYIAYDKYGREIEEQTRECSADICLRQMQEYGIPEENYYGDCGGDVEFNELYNKWAGKVDKIVLINVLHEIAPEHWASTFQQIYKLLKDIGVLIIVELKELTIGEKPLSSDYFVLQTSSLAKLLKCEEDKFIKISDKKRKREVVAYIIFKSLLNNVSDNTVSQALSEIGKISEKEIKDMKKSDSKDAYPWEKGVRYAFYTHQYTNAALYDYDKLNNFKEDKLNGK